ncbi:uncharacterized protein L969DRAFT_95755 [Mixia osmundae IAM 14324]|uniref:Uncharacterized protein n=1 Tax=Mixia osmundae (strain CBS 9802 / IAM 14324 / JCM 22182 / KY 12970) TaxID=764103 RepID=G7DSN9_MIXOS|nr:uncharacterized protein L969DRAFT_95755 [Mixia osmundae IAM 14324]KEI37904.1 hypothetical protein L969DRAFT_95755 [Mixia osmundae IAM 14324]GAA93599.1 hypothetical protein E5Q_00243 [Mixia osmundae IAM 14324]
MLFREAMTSASRAMLQIAQARDNGSRSGQHGPAIKRAMPSNQLNVSECTQPVQSSSRYVNVARLTDIYRLTTSRLVSFAPRQIIMIERSDLEHENCWHVSKTVYAQRVADSDAMFGTDFAGLRKHGMHRP